MCCVEKNVEVEIWKFIEVLFTGFLKNCFIQNTGGTLPKILQKFQIIQMS